MGTYHLANFKFTQEDEAAQMIDPKKLYRTRDGREVRIYDVNCGGDWPVHGAVREEDEWEIVCWTADGRSMPDGILRDYDIFEVRPRIQREVWVNVYKEDKLLGIYTSWEKAHVNSASGRIACVKLVIDCEEGTGL